MSEIIKIDPAKAKVEELFAAITNIDWELSTSTAKDMKRMPRSIGILAHLSNGYIPNANDHVVYDQAGNPSLKNLAPSDLLHNKPTWEIMGVNKGRLPNVFKPDGTPASMTINGIVIDPSDLEVSRKLNLIRNYPPSVINESLDKIAKITDKYLVVKAEKKRPESLYGPIENLQSAKIVLQNKLFDEKELIKAMIKKWTTNIVLDHNSAITMRETLKRYVAMLEQAESKVTGYGNDALVETICETFWDHLRKYPAKNADEVSLTHLIHEIRSEREQGNTTEFFYLLDKIVAVFKPAEESGETLHAALMANHVPDEPIPPRRFAHVENHSGDRRNGGAGKRKAEITIPLSQNTIESLVMKLIDTVNNLKADIGGIRKMIANPDATSRNRKDNFQKGPTKEKFANAAAVQKSSSKPVPLTNRVVTAAESDDDSDQAANFAGKSILSCLPPVNNKNVLGRACTHPMHEQAPVGSEIETININSERTDEQLQPMKIRRVDEPIDPRLFCEGPFFGTIVSQSAGGVEEMVVLPDDTERIQSYLDANPKSQLNRIIMYMPVYPADNGTGIKTNNNQPTPQPEATPIAEEDEFMSCPNTPCEQQEMAPKCTIPPNAPQVEKIVLETSSSSVKSDKLAISEKPRTRSVSRAGKFTIPESIDDPDGEQESFYTVVPKPYGFKESFHACKLPEGYTGEEERVFNKTIREAQATSRTSPTPLRAKGRKEFTMLMSHITKTAMDDMKSNGAPPLLHIDNPELDDTPAGEYDDLPELIEGDSGEM